MKALRFLSRMMRDLLLAANILVCAGFLLSAYSPFINPVSHKYLACLGFVFPAFALLCALFLVWWLIAKPAFALISLLTMLLGWNSLTTYFSIGGTRKAKGETIKVLTWNTMGKMLQSKEDDLSDNLALTYVLDSGADIVCLQEYNPRNEKIKKEVDKHLAKSYPYRQYVKAEKGNGMMCASRFPIISHERIFYESKNNFSVAYRIKLGADTLFLVNNHLESTKINGDDKEEYNRLLKTTSKDSIKATSKHLVRKLADAAAMRAPQADSVAKAVELNKTKLMIVCGDFNDSPISYCHHTVGRGLNDCFAKAGWGMGVTYNDARMYFRIDHIFASKAFKVTECKVDRSINVSDHYPLWAVLSPL